MSGDRLPPELQLIAKTELGETDQGKIDALNLLRRLLNEKTDLNACKDDGFLLRFLRVRKYDIDAALKTILTYYRNRAACPSVYCTLVPSSVKLAARNMCMVLPKPDVHGRPVFLMKPGSWDPGSVTFSEVHQALVLVLEYMATDPVAQTVGISCIVDYDEFTIGKMFYLNFGLFRRCVEFMLCCVPVRLKAIHVVRQSYTFDMVLSIAQPFISKKIAERIHMHGFNFEGLHAEASPSMLPEEYGGQAPPLDFEAFWSLVEQEESTFADSSRYGYSETNADVSTSYGDEAESTYL